MTGIGGSLSLSNVTGTISSSTENREDLRWNGRAVVSEALDFFRGRLSATTISSLFSSFCSFLNPTDVHQTTSSINVVTDRPKNRVDVVFEILNSHNLMNDLIKIVLLYDQDKYYDIVSMVDKGDKLSDDIKKDAESCTVLDLFSYKEKIKSIAPILRVFKNVEILFMPYKAVGKDLDGVPELKNLKEFNLHLGEVTDFGLAPLAQITTLQSINLECCLNITGFSLALLVTLTALNSLNLRMCSQVTDYGLQQIAALTSLHSLNLESCDGITDKGVAFLVTLTALTSLNLEHCWRITNTGLASLTTMTTLQILNLSGCTIRDAGLNSLAALTALKSLKLGGCLKITDVGLLKLKTLQILKFLDIDLTEVTDTGLLELAEFKKLKKLFVRDCLDITEDGLAKARRINPLLEIRDMYEDNKAAK